MAEGPTVFLSHSHKDQDQVRHLKYWLEQAGINPWASFEGCQDQYRVEIDSALRKSDIFVFIASESSYLSDEVKHEVACAHERKKPFIYYRLDKKSHLEYDGFSTILSGKQFVEQQQDPLGFPALATAIINEYSKLSSCVNLEELHSLISKATEEKNKRLNQWREQLWRFKDSTKKRERLTT